MLTIRLFESEMHRLFLKGEVHGTTHLSSGQEAVSVGVCSSPEPKDYVTGAYRGHGPPPAQGTHPEPPPAGMPGGAPGGCGGGGGGRERPTPPRRGGGR